jgi:hypothetical protein
MRLCVCQLMKVESRDGGFWVRVYICLCETVYLCKQQYKNLVSTNPGRHFIAYQRFFLDMTQGVLNDI